MRLNTYLKINKLTQRTFAQRIKLDEATVSRLIAGPQMPSITTIRKVRDGTNNQVTWVDLIAPKVNEN